MNTIILFDDSKLNALCQFMRKDDGCGGCVDPDGRISFEGLFRWAFKQDYGIEVEDSVEVAIKTAEELLPEVEFVAGLGPKTGFNLGPIKAEIGGVAEINTSKEVSIKGFARATVNGVGPQISKGYDIKDLNKEGISYTSETSILLETKSLHLELEQSFLGFTVPVGPAHIGVEFYRK